jgi:hypothetical protein
MKNQKFVKIMIAGGLGNQLFIYFAGLCLATEKNYKLKVDLLYRALHHSKFDLTSFVLPGEFIPRNRTSSLIWKFLWRCFDYSNLRGPSSLRNILLKLFKVVNEDSIGEDYANSVVRGSFTTIEYTEAAINKYKFELELRSPSDWYLGMRNEIKKNPAISLHIRRTDSLANWNSDGVLGEIYYENALRIATEKIGKVRIFLFSDDLESVSKWNMFKDYQVTCVRAPMTQKNDPAEYLMLMTHTKVNIIGNSSFAIFAALFNPNNPTVICPSQALRNNRISKEKLYRPNWVSVESVWLNI